MGANGKICKNKKIIQQITKQMENKESKQIDFVQIYKAAFKHKWAFAVSLSLALLLSSIFIVSIPRYYNCTIELAPETSSGNISSLGSLASQFGVNISDKMVGQEDAISPELYPNLVSSTDYLVSMFSVNVKTKDHSYNGNYYTYLVHHQKHAWWEAFFSMIKHLFTKEEKVSPFTGKEKINTFQLTKIQSDIASLIGKNINCSTDKKTNVISISVKDQDPLVCAIIADSASSRLQSFITNYRTKKAKNDLKYIEGLYNKAMSEYIKQRRLYAAVSDANTDPTLKSVSLKIEDMENDMQLKYNNVTSLTVQLQAARAKVRERTPAFTTIQSATVPIKPAGPKRMFFVAFMMLITFVGTIIYSIALEEKNKVKE